MSIEYDEKGKFYTEVVTKLPTSAIIQTTTHQVRGLIHVRQGERFKGELERDERFLAVTRATIHDAQGNVILEAPFLVIQREQIVWALPTENQQAEESE